MVNSYMTLSAAEPMYILRMGVEWFMHGVGLHLNDMKYHIDIEIKS